MLALFGNWTVLAEFLIVTTAEPTRSQLIGCRVTKLCTKFEWDRLIRGWVIDDLIQLFGRFQGVPQNDISVLRKAWTDLTKFGRNTVRSSLHTKFKKSSDILLRFETRAAQSWAIRPKIALWPAVGHIWFNFSKLSRLQDITYSASACKISTRSVHVRLSYWRLSKVFTSIFMGYPQNDIDVLKRTWADLQQIWCRHCPINAT